MSFIRDTPPLERVEFTLLLPSDAQPDTAALSAHGRSPLRRPALWSYHETFDTTLDAHKGYGVQDAMAHIVLVCMQDRPNTLDRLDFALSGGLAYVQEALGLG